MTQSRPMKTIQTTRLDADLQQLIRAAGEGKLRVTVVEDDGRQIAEVRPVDLWAGYDPVAARRAWRDSAGVLCGVDVEALLADLKAEREQDSPGRPAS